MQASVTSMICLQSQGSAVLVDGYQVTRDLLALNDFANIIFLPPTEVITRAVSESCRILLGDRVCKNVEVSGGWLRSVDVGCQLHDILGSNLRLEARVNYSNIDRV